MTITTWYGFSLNMVRIKFFQGEIARKIEQARAIKPIGTTTELAEIKSAKPARERA